MNNNSDWLDTQLNNNDSDKQHKSEASFDLFSFAFFPIFFIAQHTAFDRFRNTNRSDICWRFDARTNSEQLFFSLHFSALPFKALFENPKPRRVCLKETDDGDGVSVRHDELSVLFFWRDRLRMLWNERN